MTPAKVKPGSRGKIKLRAGTKVKPGPGPRGLVKVKLRTCGSEDWKILRSFVGVKFNDEEKRKLWPAVSASFVWKNGERKGTRANLSTFIKDAIWEKVLRARKV